MLAVLAAISLCVCIYFALVRPLQGYRDAARADYAAAAEIYQEVAAAADALKQRSGAASASTRVSDDRPVRVIASATARDLGLGITRIQPVNDTDVSFWFDGAGVRDLFRWMVQMETDHGVSITKADIQKSPGGETVQAQVVLGRTP